MVQALKICNNWWAAAKYGQSGLENATILVQIPSAPSNHAEGDGCTGKHHKGDGGDRRGVVVSRTAGRTASLAPSI